MFILKVFCDPLQNAVQTVLYCVLCRPISPFGGHPFVFLVITRTGSLGFCRDLVGIFPRSLPQLSKQLRDQHNSQKPKKKNKSKKYILAVFSSNLMILDMPGCLYMQFFTRNPILRSKIWKSDG